MSGSTVASKSWIYTQRPTGAIGPEHYKLVQNDVRTDDLEATEVLLRGRYYSVDPYMRIQQASSYTWENPHPVDTVQSGAVVGQVVAVGRAVTDIKPNDWVYAYSGWREYARVPVSEVTLLPEPSEAVPASTALGVLGMPGRTAYFGLFEAGRPRPNDVLVVSGCAGAVGVIVAQLGKKAGCTVVGVAGTKEKCDALTSPPYNLDYAINYKEHSTKDAVKLELKRIAPHGVDIYFDNTGGHITDAVMETLALRARVVICGQISVYNDGLEDTPIMGPRFLHQLIYKRATITGILARDFTHRNDEMLRAMRPMVEKGEMQIAETVMHGFESLPDALAGLFTGKNTGKMIVAVE